jgi:hypothetical protein
MSGHKRLKEHKKHEKKAHGGKINEYNAKGSPEIKEAENEKEGFKKGGAKKKEGGHAEGKKPHKRLDKAARGGHIKKHAAGGSPFSSAAARKPYSNKGAGEGHDMEKGEKPEDMQSDKEGHNKDA